MVEYTDGLAWAAVNVCNLQFAAGSVSSYYISAGIMLIGSMLAVLFPDTSSQAAGEQGNDFADYPGMR